MNGGELIFIQAMYKNRGFQPPHSHTADDYATIPKEKRENIEHENMLTEKNAEPVIRAAHTLALICSRMLSMALATELLRCGRGVLWCGGGERPQRARSTA